MLTRSKTIKSGIKLQTFENSINDEAMREIQAKTNPLYIPEVVDHIFHFLKLADIKNCRLVCRKWNQLAENLQGKLSVVKMIDSQRVEDFNEMFPNAQESQIFSRFVLGEDESRFDWPSLIYEFANFLTKWQQNLSEITLFGLDFGPDTKRNRLASYNLSALLPSTLTKLKLQSGYTKMIVSTNKLCNLEVLDLEDCTLVVTTGIILNSLEIRLHRVTFMDNEEEIKEFLINPLLNFDVLKKARFDSENISLDLQGSLSLDVLKLDGGIKVLNWETSQWEIKKKFKFFDAPVEIGLVKNQMKYKVLKIDLNQLNVGLLPEGIEKSKLYPQNNTGRVQNPRIYGYHNFRNLKTLHISLPVESDFSPLVEHFKHCFNLTTLSVSMDGRRPCCGRRSAPSTLLTSSIPPSVNTLHVDDVRLILDQRLELVSLILHDYEYHGGEYMSLSTMVTDLQVKNLVWFLDGFKSAGGRYIFDKNAQNVVKNLINLNMDNFAVGDFSQVKNHLFKRSYLFPLVDEQAKYYLFRHGDKGKAMSDNDVKYWQKRNM